MTKKSYESIWILLLFGSVILAPLGWDLLRAGEVSWIAKSLAVLFAGACGTGIFVSRAARSRECLNTRSIWLLSVVVLVLLLLLSPTWAAKGLAVLVVPLVVMTHSARRRLTRNGALPPQGWAVWLQRFGPRVALVLILLLVVAPASISIWTRHITGPHTHAHDSVIQTEEAIRFLLDGRNPYAVTYEGTPLSQWPDWRRPYPNPALYNLVYFPFVFLVGVPFYLLFEATAGWFDYRILILLAFGITLWVVWKLSRDRLVGTIGLLAAGLSPLVAPYIVEGRNDILVLALLGLSLYLVTRDGWRWRLEASAFSFGLACATKQTAWFFLPFYTLYLWGSFGGAAEPRILARSAVILRRWLLPVVVTVAVAVLPFLLLSPSRFLEGTVFFLSGRTEHNYPIKATGAYGFHVLLSSPPVWGLLDAMTSGPLGVLQPVAEAVKIRSETQHFPFWIFQAAFALPVFALALWRQVRENTLAVALAGYSLGLLAFQYFSRYFHDNHIGYLTAVLLLAYILDGSSRQGAARIGGERSPRLVDEPRAKAWAPR